MQGDFSRWTFDRHAAYRAVLLQQGRVVLDADWNEQTQITAHHDEIRTLDVVGRAGGPVGHAAFGITNAAGLPPEATPWADLRITAGRFYVDGVLAEVEADAAGAGPPLAAQPYLPGAEPPGAQLPGLPEPGPDGRYAVVLEVRNDHVTADEESRLRESALGGPDTTTRAQTVWQLTLKKVDNDESCAEAHVEPWLHDDPPTMTASLEDVPAETDPCRITTSAGYRRLENQLYRVQIHDIAGGNARYLWSRENGSVVAELIKIGPTTAPAMDAELSLDREGRDEELSIGPSKIVEVTSAGRRLHQLPGFLARTGAPRGQSLPVKWIGTPPANLAALGRSPIVRRWEGEPKPADASKDKLEDGIEVRFDTGDFRVGDHWLIPARTVRLVYGQTALAGTIEWPRDRGGTPLPQPPVGPLRHRTVVALLDRATTGGSTRWTLHADCRPLGPSLTQLVSLDLLGGDGQEAPPGASLPEPVRVVVRNGGLPVVGARVRFAAAGGHLSTPSAAPKPGDPATLPRVSTDGQGHAEVRWLLDAAGATTQVLTATLLDDADDAVGAQVRVTGRLSIAKTIGYDPAKCGDTLGAARVETVQQALDALCQRPTITFPGIHVEEVLTIADATAPFSIADARPIENDSEVGLNRLAKGVYVRFDEAIGTGWGKDPVLRLTVEVPWPGDPSQRDVWTDAVGTQAIALRAHVETRGRFLVWLPDDGVADWLGRVVRTAAALGGEEHVLVRLTVLGNAVASEDGKRFLNGRAFGRLAGDRIALQLPTVDHVHGADFSMWFWLTEQGPPRMEVTPTSLAFAGVLGLNTLAVVVSNPGGEDLRLSAATQTTPPAGNIFRVTPARDIVVRPGERVRLLITREGTASATGQLILTPADARVGAVSVPLTTGFPPQMIPVRGGALRLKPLRQELAEALGGPEGDPERATARLRAELDQRGEPLRVAVTPGFEGAFEVLRDALAPTGVTVERVDGEPVDLVRQAREGAVVLDAVLGGTDIGDRLSQELGPAVLAPVEG